MAYQQLSPAVLDRLQGELRWKMDILDDQLAALLERRLALSLEIQAVKAERGLPNEDPVREAAIEERLLLAGRNPEVAAMVRGVASACRASFASRRASATSRGRAGSSTPP